MKNWKLILPVAALLLLAGQVLAQSDEEKREEMEAQKVEMEARKAEYSVRLRMAEERMEQAAREIAKMASQRLPDVAMIERVQELAIVCHEALQCDGLSRTDMIVTDDGPVVLEVNTMPGFTTESLFPKAAAGHGIAYPELLARLLDLALMLPTRKETLS